MANNVKIFNDTPLYQIHFTFEKVNRRGGYTKRCTNPMAYDTEASSGYRNPKTGTIFPFNKKSYDEAHLRHFGEDHYKHYLDMFEKVGVTYAHMFAIKDDQGVHFYMFRTFTEVAEFMEKLDLEIARRMRFGRAFSHQQAEADYNYIRTNGTNARPAEFVLYVHNLGYDFQSGIRNIPFLSQNIARKRGMFARKLHKPLKTSSKLIYNKCTFKDSYVLARRSLADWLKDESIPVQKLVGDLDYMPIRTPNTPLTPQEIGYCINDVIGLVLVIEKYAKDFNGLYNIPLTQTGIVRRKCVACVPDDWKKEQSNIMRDMDYAEFNRLHSIFLGGWTHANPKRVGTVYSNVRCFDFTSSYPYVMCCFKFPTSRFAKVDPKDIVKYGGDPQSLKRDHCYYVKVRFTGVEARVCCTFWPGSRHEKDGIKKEVLDNGKIYSCDELVAYMTDLDYTIFKQAYKIETEEILELYVAEATLLPKELILLILEQFEYKTNFKDVPGKETLYVVAKQFVNAIYGCAVTNFVSDIILFREKPNDPSNDFYWDKTTLKELEDKGTVDVYFKNTVKGAYTPSSTFLSYQIGCWITAHARYNLWSLILQLDEKVIYGDTDSLKGLFDKNSIQIINMYNERVKKHQEEVAKLLGFDVMRFRPMKPNGERVCLGIFDEEEPCIEFKTWGAKRYCYKYHDKKKNIDVLKTTVAGIPKKNGAEKFDEVDDFDRGTIWYTDESGKNIITYREDQGELRWVDLYGNEYISNQKFAPVITPTTFKLELGSDFSDFLDIYINNKQAID